MPSPGSVIICGALYAHTPQRYLCYLLWWHTYSLPCIAQVHKHRPWYQVKLPSLQTFTAVTLQIGCQNLYRYVSHMKSVPYLTNVFIPRPATWQEFTTSPELQTLWTFLLLPPLPPSTRVLQFASLLYVSVRPSQCEAGRPMCPQTEELLQLTITQQVSVIFRGCITVCPCLLSNYCLDTGSMANLSLTPNTKPSPRPQKHSSSLSALLTKQCKPGWCF